MFPTIIRAALVTDSTAMRGSDPSARPHSTRPSRRWRAAAGLLAGLLVAITACGGDPSATTAGVEQTDQTDQTDLEVERPAADSPDVAALAEGLNAVGYDLFRAEVAHSSEDVVLSPLSIGLAFGMLDVGATGPTAQALDDLFAYPVEGEARWSAFNTLDQQLVDTEGAAGEDDEMIVRLANRQFPDEAFEPVEGYDETIARWFGAGIEPLPIQADRDAARERINGWVSERTEGRIPDLLPDSSPSVDTLNVLVNAVYYEADWDEPFDEDRTEDDDFTRLDGTTVTVPMMTVGGIPGPAAITDDYEAVVLSYADRDYQMLLVVPTEGHYAEVEAAFDADLVATIRDEMEGDRHTAAGGNLVLYLPRFDSATSLPLRERLERDLGVTGLFEMPGGLAGIHEDLELGDAFHAATIEVDEEGTVATAATALDEEAGVAEPPPPIEIRADRPFLYLIHHRPTGANLFVGRCLDPSV
jgi:serpin B